jgi:hypothetical protein
VTGRLGYCPQEPQVYERLTCDEHFELFGHAYALSSAAQLAGRRGPLWRSGSGSTRPPVLTGGTLAKLNLGLALLASEGLRSHSRSACPVPTSSRPNPVNGRGLPSSSSSFPPCRKIPSTSSSRHGMAAASLPGQHGRGGPAHHMDRRPAARHQRHRPDRSPGDTGHAHGRHRPADRALQQRELPAHPRPGPIRLLRRRPAT